jgi:fatty acid/phospholipid biosynthesis enzyme
MIGHGSSDARAIRNAILKARQQVRTNINDKIAAYLQGATAEEEA